MNPNIRALALKAGQNNGAQHAIDIPVWFLERFALLIINDCTRICDEIQDINRTYKEQQFIDPEFGPKECKQAINEYFGIE